MSKSAQVPGGVVTSLQGHAKVIPAGKGPTQALQVGDTLQPGDLIVANQDTQLQVTDASGANWAPHDTLLALADTRDGTRTGVRSGHGALAAGKTHAGAPGDLDRVLDAVNRGDDDSATAAGLGAGGGGSLSEGLRAERVIETVTPQEFAYSLADRVPPSALSSGAVGADATTAPTPTNQPPKVVDEGNPNFKPASASYELVTPQDHPVSGQVKATDPDGDALTFSKGSDPAHGSVTVNADGTWTYTPAKDYNGADQFTVTVSDGHGGTATSTIDIGITPVNDPPKVTDPGNEQFDPATGNYHLTTDEDKPVSGQVKATDADGDALTFAKGSDPAHGSVVVNADGTWTYTPAKDYNGSDSFTVTVSDGHGGTATSTIDIGINPVNDPPKVTDPGNEQFDPATGNYHLTTDEDKPVSGQVKATDADGDALTFSKGSDPAHGSVVVNADGTWTYTPAKDYNGADQFTVTVSDGHGGTATSTIDIGITPVNDPPKVTDPGNEQFDPATGNYHLTTDEDKPVSGQVKATDADGDALTFAKGSDPAHGSVVVNADGTWTYTPSTGYNGADQFTVTVSDGHGGTATSTIDIGINPVNDPPKVTDPGNEQFDPATGNYHLTTDEDKPVSGQVKATDADGDALTFAKGSDPAHGSVVVNADGTWTYTPAKDYNGADSFTVTVSDGHGGTATSTIDIGINPVNDPPKVTDPGNEQFDPATGNYHLTTDEDKPVSGQVKATDPDGDALTFAKGSDPAHGSVVVNADGTWTYTPAKDYNGADQFTVTVSDGHGGTATSTIDIGITPVNDPPKVTDPGNEQFDPATGNYHLTTDEDKPVSGQVKATDPDGDALTFAKGSDPAHGSVVVNADGTWTYTPAKDYNGADQFTVTVSDGHGGTATSTIDIGITPVNDPPKVTDPGNEQFDPATGNYHLTTDEDKPVSGQVKATDADGDALTFAKGSDPAHGSVTVNADGTWTYTPAKDYNGADQFTVTVSDGHGGTATSTIDIGITPVNDPPKVTDPGNEQFDPATGNYHLTTDEDKPVSGQVKATDPDGDALTFAKGSDPTHGSVTVNADGTWTYTPAKDYNGADQFTVTVSDGHGGTATSTIDIGINPVNDAPVVTIRESGHDILGLVDVSANPLFDLSKHHQVSVNDVDNNLVRVDISVDQLLSLGSLLGDHSKLSVSADLAASLGLHLVGNDSRHLVIESNTPGQQIDIGMVNQLLATLSYDPAQVLGLVSVELFPKLTITATDAYGLSDTKSVSSGLIAIEVNPPEPPPPLPPTDEPPVPVPPKKDDKDCEDEPKHEPKPKDEDKDPAPPKPEEPKHEEPKGEAPPKVKEPHTDNQPEHDKDPKHEPKSEHEKTPDTEPKTEHKADTQGPACDDKDDRGTEGHGGAQSGGHGTGAESHHDQDTPIAGDKAGGGEHTGSIEHLGLGSPVFAWTLSDKPSEGEHSGQAQTGHTTVHDFNCAPIAEGGDVLDLRDLLHADTHHASADQLLNFLNFDTQSVPGSTVIHVSASGDLHSEAHANATQATQASAEPASPQHIVLSNVDVRGDMGLDAHANDHQVITELMHRGKLLVDNHG